MKKVKGKIVDVISKNIFAGEIHVQNGFITEIRATSNAPDCYILPGFIDSHIHIESSMLCPSAFAEIAIKHGTVAVVSDPHEIANVLGKDGVEFMIEDGKRTPLKFFFGAPSCVPATTHETSGYNIGTELIDELLSSKDIYFLAEMMNFPGVIFDDASVIQKIQLAHKYAKPIDGHAPCVTGEQLKKYYSAGITTDHECSTLAEALEKLNVGMKIQIREGSAAKNFETLYSLIESHTDQVMLCSDDLHPDDLLKGHINLLVKRCLKLGIDIFKILQVTTVNPVNHYNLDVGLLRKGDSADFIIIDNFVDVNILDSYICGEPIYKPNVTLEFTRPLSLPNNFNCTYIKPDALQIIALSKQIRVINCFDGELLTKQTIESAKIEDGLLVSDIEKDILKIVVYNRYSKFIQPAIGFIKNFSLKSGALASSIAHDSHNIVAVGTDDESICHAINKVIDNKGGISVFHSNTCKNLALPIAGLMSNEKVEVVADKYQLINEMAHDLGCKLAAPFMTLSFMALLVIPELKIGDKGLFDVKQFQHTSLFI